ncbi:MAG: zinc metalloprotease HtpX [Halothiobacillaceae bacterium]
MLGAHLRNALQTLALLIGMAMVLGGLGWILGSWGGVAWALLMVLATLLLVPRLSGDLLARLMGAMPLGAHAAPELHELLVRLTERAGLDRLPRLYLLPGPSLQAMSFGSRDAPAIAVTEGLLFTLDRRELAAVLAHELAHLRNNDLGVMLLAAVVGRITALLALVGQIMLLLALPAMALGVADIPWLALLVLAFAPLVSDLLQLGLSRTREYDADHQAALLTGDPEGLARVLIRLERAQRSWWEAWFTPLRQWEPPSWLRTHPPTEERVRRLLELVNPAGHDFD